MFPDYSLVFLAILVFIPPGDLFDLILPKSWSANDSMFDVQQVNLVIQPVNLLLLLIVNSWLFWPIVWYDDQLGGYSKVEKVMVLLVSELPFLLYIHRSSQ